MPNPAPSARAHPLRSAHLLPPVSRPSLPAMNFQKKAERGLVHPKCIVVRYVAKSSLGERSDLCTQIASLIISFPLSSLFCSPSGLQTHMNIHNNLKPFICGFRDCLKTFSVRSNAKRHRLTHTGTASKPPPTPTYRVSSHFIEDLPMPPPPSPGPFSLSQVPFRVRWNAPNAPARNSAHPVHLSGVEPVAGTVLPTNGIHARYDRSSSGAEP
ncbi:hypothetical protein C8R43DRAFT_89618 [Mycena crocata]|nr:hypothetical protein C8R43DRAFT_89618 [Mycena crocata]